MLKIVLGFALLILEVLLIFMIELFPIEFFSLFDVLVLPCEVVLFNFVFKLLFLLIFFEPVEEELWDLL